MNAVRDENHRTVDKPGVDEKSPFLAYLGLGSNIEPQKNLPKAVELLEKELKIATISTAWVTPAVGSEGPDFINAAIAVCTSLVAETLKDQVIRKVETRLGRVRTSDKNAPRTIDIDILIFDDRIVDELIWEEAFLAVPLAELIPNFCNPENGETLAEAAARLSAATRILPKPEVLPGNRQSTSQASIKHS